jgi:hypothetical protein
MPLDFSTSIQTKTDQDEQIYRAGSPKQCQLEDLIAGSVTPVMLHHCIYLMDTEQYLMIS